MWTESMNASLTFNNKHQAIPIHLDQDLVLVGSGSNADVVVEDSNLSPLHCAIVHTCDGWKVVDLYSRQGTRVNDRSVTDHILQPGDRIRLGKISATFEMTEDEPPAKGGEVKLEDGCGEGNSLESGSALIGSWGGCDIVADGADPAHVIVVYSQRGARVRAVGETGVVIINGRKTSGCALQDGDVLQVGKEQFTVRAPHLLRRSNFEPVRGVRADSPGPKNHAMIEESNRIVQLLKPIGQVPDEIRQLREDFGQQFQSLTEGMKSITDAVEDKDRKVNDRADEHTSQIQSFGRNLAEHGDLVKELMDRLGRIVDAAESSKDASESAVGKLGQAREWLETELNSRDKALQKVWEGLVQIRKTLATSSPDASTVGAVSELREQIASLDAQYAEARSQLPQQLADAIQGLPRKDPPALAELAKQREALTKQEQRLVEERKALSEAKREISSRDQEALRERTAAEQQHEQREADLDQKGRRLTQRVEKYELSQQEAEKEYRRRKQYLEERRQKLQTLNIEVEIHEAHLKEQASKLIRMCQRVARLDGTQEGIDASIQLIALAKNIAGKIEQPRHIIDSAVKSVESVATERLLHCPPSDDDSELFASPPVDSSPISSLNNRS